MQLCAQSAYTSSTTYIGGYHIKCHGQSTGTINANPNFGTPPYTFLWNTGENTAQISNKPAGIYVVTITDQNNISQTDTFELLQPYLLNYQSVVSNFNGYEIDAHGAHSGSIQLSATGGTPPYRYYWSDADSSVIKKDLAAGTYQFTITDANQCSTSASYTLNEPGALQVSFSNIQQLTCFKSNNGKATINITGGLGNYDVVWDNGSFSMSPDNLKAGYNAVRIYERGRAVLDTGITLTQPDAIEVQFAKSNYNGYNVSCVDCFNGSISTTVTGGTAPYTYLWNDANNSSTPNLSNLNGGEYELMIMDANACKMSSTVQLSMPNPKDWSRYGNSNIDNAQFIGSTDASDVVFKANNQEAISIRNDTVKFSAKLRLMNFDLDTLLTDNSKIIGMDENGNLKAYRKGDIQEGPTGFPPGCNNCGCTQVLAWGQSSNIINGVVVPVNSNDIVKCPVDGNVGIGTTLPEANSKLDIIGEIAIAGERLSVGYNGNVGIGIGTPDEKLQLFGGNFKITNPWDYQNPVFFVNSSNKNAGIGTGLPRGKFEIKMSNEDHISFGNMRTEESGWATSFIGFNAFREVGGTWKTTGDNSNSGAAVIFTNTIGDLMFSTLNGENVANEFTTNDAGVKGASRMILTNDGRLGIGINPKNHFDLLSYRLVVDGNIKCKKLRVDLQNWGDFVFDDGYQLMDLNSIEQFISKNKHLPGMPSAQEIEKDGADLGEIVKLQQVKIEELTLYLIELKKENEEMKIILNSKK